jgi:putative ABC transport system ATP-binding protein
MAGVAIDVRDLSHGYDTPRGWLRVLDRVTLSLPAGGYGAVTGSSGAGKTTLLAVLGGLERPDEGDVRVGGHDVARLAGDDLAAYRRTTVGFVFQHFGLLDALTAAENVELACTLAAVPPSRRRARAGELLDAVGLSARAMANSPARRRCREASGSGWPSPGPWPTPPPWCWPTNPPATSTPSRPSGS